MKLAILGADATTLALARAAMKRADCELTHIVELETSLDSAAAELLGAVARSAKPLESWESLLDLQLVDAVLIARGSDDDRRTDQIRKLCQAGMPMLLSHPVVLSMLIYYELDMIRRENGAIVMPALGDRLHPAMREIMSLIDLPPAQSPIGKIEQVAIDRQMIDRSKTAVLTQFARDVDLLRFLSGELNQIGAMGTAGEEAAYGNLNVQMTGPTGLLARWAVGPVDSGVSGDGRLIVTGADGKATLNMPGDGNAWTYSVAKQTTQDFPRWNSASIVLDKFVRLTQAEPIDPDTPDLLDAARGVELTETIGRSLARKRTIELHYGDHSEENTFKSKMAAGGCVMLMLGLFLLMVVILLDQAGVPFVKHWPKLLFGVLGIFLLLQLLTFVFKRDASS